MPLAERTLVALAQELGRALGARRWRVATAESCTGGLVAAAITAVAGSSAWFERGCVTYSDDAKREMLGVGSELLDRHGAVSEAVAGAMAEGALAHGGADCAVGVTGIAGPDGGTATKPVGMVCFGWASRGSPSIVATRHFAGNREAVRQAAVAVALAGLIERARGVPQA